MARRGASEHGRSRQPAAGRRQRGRGFRPAAEGLESRQLLSLTELSPAKGAGWLSRIDPQLLDLLGGAGPGAPSDPARDGLPLVFDEAGRVGVDITTSDANRLVPALEALGFQLAVALPARNLVEGFLPVGSLTAAAALEGQGLLGILGINRPQTGTGSVNSQADFVLEADRVRATVPPGLDGAGVRVGVLSDSYNRLGGAAADVASGDLPNNVQVVLEGPASGVIDEGRAMIQLVHDLAPGSPKAFGSAFFGQAQFGQTIRDLANPAIFGAGVITDDIFYFEEPLFQDGLIAQAIDDVVANRGAAYFALAGNLGTQSYESTAINFAADSGGIFAGNFFDFDPGAGVDTRQRITIQNNQQVIINLQWDDPFFTANGVDTDIDIFLIDSVTGNIVAGSVRNNPVIQQPSEIFSFANTTGAARGYDVLIQRFSGPNPGRIKYVNYGANNSGPIAFNEFATNSSTVIPHAAANLAEGVGAAPYFDHLNPESFTSVGPNTILFAANGTPLGAADVRQTPDITAIDGTDTTFFGGDIGGEGNTAPNFFGTSAAAPHAAAVAALLRQAQPALTPLQVYARLESTAADIVNAGLGAGVGFDNRTGFGLINAYDAIFAPVVPGALNFADGLESGALSRA